MSANRDSRRGRGGRLVLVLSSCLLLLGFGAFPIWAQDQKGDAAPQTSIGGQEPEEDESTLAEVADQLADDESGFCYEIYQVARGDTVENIAARFGILPERIRQFNNLDSSDLAVGQSLAIPLPGRSRKQFESPLPLNILEPCYAEVTGPVAITTEPTSALGPGDVLYQPQVGTEVIVNAEQGEYWGVVMMYGSIGWIPKSSVKMTDRKISAEQLDAMIKGSRPDIVQEAYRYLGTPYCYGGHLPYSVDCSLLVQTVFAAKGVQLPRTAAAQFEVGSAVGYSELLPGDRLYFVSRSGRINHAGIYTGNGRFIHASSRRGCVAVDSLYDRTYWMRFIGARR